MQAALGPSAGPLQGGGSPTRCHAAGACWMAPERARARFSPPEPHTQGAESPSSTGKHDCIWLPCVAVFWPWHMETFVGSGHQWSFFQKDVQQILQGPARPPCVSHQAAASGRLALAAGGAPGGG